MWAEKKRKRPHEWLEGVLGVLGLAPSTHISQIIQKVLKGYTSTARHRFIIIEPKILVLRLQTETKQKNNAI
jgi:hypothetical protein